MRINLQTLNAFTKLNARKVNNNPVFMSSFVTSPLKADTFERTTSSSSTLSFEGNNVNSKKKVNKNGEVREATDFAVKGIHNIECPVCEKITMDTKDIDEYVDNVAFKKGKELVDAIDYFGDEYYWTADPASKGKTVYRENVEGILEVVKRLALEHPHSNLKDIVKIAAKDAMPDLVGKQLNVISEINAYTLNNVRSKNECEAIFKVADRHRNLILDRVQGQHFKRKAFLADLSKVYLSDEEKKKEIMEIAKKLPASTDDRSSFFVKYATDPKRGVREIATRFVNENRPTGEHIDCFSNGGANDKNNYICDCAYCNSKRSDTSFKIWARTIPNFQDSLQKYLDTVQTNIDNHNLPDNYKNYSKDIIDVIDAQSDGEIKLMHPYEYRESQKVEFAKRTQQKIEQRKIKYKETSEEFDKIKREIKKSYINVGKLESELSRAQSEEEKAMLQEKIEKEELKQAELKEKTMALKQELRVLSNQKIKL